MVTLRKTIKITFGVLMFLFVFLSSKILQTSVDQDIIEKRIKIFPKNTVNVLFRNNIGGDIQFPNKNIILIFFNSECIYCGPEVDEIMSHKELLENSFILFITNESKIDLESFLNDKNLKNQTDLFFLSDHNKQLFKYYNVKSIPSIYLYSQDKTLLMSNNGMIGAKKIFSYYGK